MADRMPRMRRFVIAICISFIAVAASAQLTAALSTLRDIASHRSGVARHDELWDDSDFSRDELIRRAGMMKVWKPIRAGYQYNNLMFVTAGEAAASAAKMPWEQLIKSRIF